MYPIWAKSTSRGEVEGPNGGLRTRCGLSSFTLCSFCVLITYLSPALPPEPNGSVRTTQA